MVRQVSHNLRWMYVATKQQPMDVSPESLFRGRSDGKPICPPRKVSRVPTHTFLRAPVLTKSKIIYLITRNRSHFFNFDRFFPPCLSCIGTQFGWGESWDQMIKAVTLVRVPSFGSRSEEQRFGA